MDHFSVTGLNLFLRCPYAWSMEYQVGIKPPKTNALFYGIGIHTALQSFYLNQDPVVALERFFTTDPSIPSSFDTERFLAEGKRLLAVYQKDSLHIDKILSLEERKTISLPHPKTGKVLPVPFTFRIDMICEINGKSYILDHKTMKGSTQKQDDFNRIQGIFYTMAYRILYGKRPDGFIQNGLVGLKTPKIQPLFFTYTVEEEVWAWNLAKQVLTCISEGSVMQTPPFLYSYYPCPARIFSCPWHNPPIDMFDTGW